MYALNEREAHFFGPVIFPPFPYDPQPQVDTLPTRAAARRKRGLRLGVSPSTPLRISRSANYIVFSPETAHHELFMECMKFRIHRREAAMTLPEVLIALLLLGLFLPSYENGNASWHYDRAPAAEGERIDYRILSYVQDMH
jgi:hypothetical protein